MISDQKIDALIARFEGIAAKMASGAESDEFVQLSRDYAELEPVAEQAKLLQKTRDELEEAREMLADPDLDEEMKALTQDEVETLEKQFESLQADLQVALLPKDKADAGGVILEVRAGTGGDEAALFAGSLFRMYQRYAQTKGFKVEVLSQSEGEVGGFKEIVAEVKGQGAYGLLKFESGVHRVQRVPETESGGRIHTSAATVAVLPEAKDIDIEVRNEDIRIDTMRASGAGGQHVNTTDSAVRITHLPTGIVVLQSEKSQHQNRARAMEVLKARLYDMERQKAADERADARKGQVGSGDRSERIRTYNFPQGRVTDHRIGLTLYSLDQVISGDALDSVIEPLIAAHQMELLAESEAN
ncbi:peptide chain release factor 1 [Ahrensia marina]|uniref:peptide chain release factor 1 n=1 Tax=Ahrensia marina TaxID=1514904 RepID=UPI0035D0F779